MAGRNEYITKGKEAFPDEQSSSIAVLNDGDILGMGMWLSPKLPIFARL